MTSITSAITSKFITALGRSQSQNAGTAIKNAASGSASQDPIKTSLRQGAQAYAGAIQGLNTLVSYVTLSKSSLENLDTLTDKMIGIAEEAKKASTSSQARRNLDERYQKLTKEFRTTVETALIQGENYLTTDGLGALFNLFGLDKSASEGIGQLFNEFVVPDADTALASEEEKGSHVIVPEDAYTTPTQITRQSTNFDKIFDSDRHINKRPEAYKVQGDLKALKSQIKKNLKVLDDATQVIQDNITLARGAGFAFLDVSNLTNITDAEKAAQLVQQKIRENAPAALAQAENLQPIAVAMLVLEQAAAKNK